MWCLVFDYNRRIFSTKIWSDAYDDTVAFLLNEQRLVSTLDGAAELAPLGMQLSYRMVSRLPVVGEVLRQGMVAVGEHVLAGQVRLARGEFRTFVLQMVSSALDEIDLTPLIRDRIDVNSIVELIDVDAVLTH